ncbi:hypothetical protein Pmani_025293 [Petrolisthes manimaculis]|uniref:Uncharacterized protein n=1 Tax=Petrolisthes manimaculis TaxID=1843537 RepID=A0AAE1P879_9EUCA|nr:hypothetical protein Pmani_025293 [Petrolisthes manimaculis]
MTVCASSPHHPQQEEAGAGDTEEDSEGSRDPREVANFGLKGLPGWPLPPPPLIEGVDRQVHRKARNWTKSLESPESPESPESLPNVSGVQGHDSHLLPVLRQQESYSPALTTVIRTSPLRKWSQENLLEQHDGSSSDEDLERQQDGDQPPTTQQQSGRQSKVSFGLFEEGVNDEEGGERGKGGGGKGGERRDKENAQGEKSVQDAGPLKKTLNPETGGREDFQDAGVSVRPERREEEVEKQEEEEEKEKEEEEKKKGKENTGDISLSLTEGQEVIKVEVNRRWRKGLYDYEGDVHSLVGAVVVDDVDVDGE